MNIFSFNEFVPYEFFLHDVNEKSEVDDDSVFEVFGKFFIDDFLATEKIRIKFVLFKIERMGRFQPNFIGHAVNKQE